MPLQHSYTKQHINPMQKRLLVALLPILLSTQTLAKPLANDKSNKEKAVTMDKKTLLENPKLLKRAMNSVLLTQHVEGIEIILPIYRELSDADKQVISYAEAILNHHNGNLPQSINNYRKILAENPQMTMARLNLAMALYTNHQSSSAREQLVRLQSEQLPENISTLIAQTINRIDRENDWKLDANFYYRQENNINNAPTHLTDTATVTYPKAKKAHGIHLDVSAQKRFNIDNNWYSNLDIGASSDFFWDNHQYDDLSLSAGVGIGYQNYKLNTTVQPFVKKRFYGTKPYSQTFGVKGKINYQLTPQWKLSSQLQWSKERFDESKYLNGPRHFASISALYIPTPKQYWTAGITYNNTKTQYKEDSYQRLGAFIGWGQEWQGGISTNISLSLGKRDYGGVDFFNIKRSDKEYGVNVALWHRNIHAFGITPKLRYSWDKTDSNHFYYNKKDEHKINLEFSKSF